MFFDTSGGFTDYPDYGAGAGAGDAQPIFNSPPIGDPTSILSSVTSGVDTLVKSAVAFGNIGAGLAAAKSNAAFGQFAAAQQADLARTQLSTGIGIQKLQAQTQLAQAQALFNKTAGTAGLTTQQLAVLLLVAAGVVAVLVLKRRR